MKHILFLFLLIAMYANINAQVKSDFTVIALSGKVEFKSHSGGQWQKLGSGASLSAFDSVKLTGNSYLGLVHSSGLTKEISKQGTYSLEKIAKSISKKVKSNKTFISSFIDKVFSNFRNSSGDDDYLKSMNHTATVERGITKQIETDFPAGSYLLNTNNQFFWKSEPILGTKYKFIILDRADKELYSKEVIPVKSAKSTVYDFERVMIDLDLSKLNLPTDVTLYWMIQSLEFPDSKTKEMSFKLISKEAGHRVINESKELLKDFKTNNAADLLIIAAFYESSGLLYQAMQYYQKAITLKPDVSDYRLHYAKFLDRINKF